MAIVEPSTPPARAASAQPGPVSSSPNAPSTDGCVFAVRVASAIGTRPAVVDRAMDIGAYAFVLDMPPRPEADLLRGRNPAIQLNIDAAAMT